MGSLIAYKLDETDDLFIRCECGTLHPASEREVEDLLEFHPDLALRLAWNAQDMAGDRA